MRENEYCKCISVCTLWFIFVWLSGRKKYRLVFEMSSFFCLIVFCLISEMDTIQAIVQSLKIKIYFFWSTNLKLLNLFCRHMLNVSWEHKDLSFNADGYLTNPSMVIIALDRERQWDKVSLIRSNNNNVETLNQREHTAGDTVTLVAAP